MAAQSPPRRRALLSVFEKTGLVELARALVEEFGFELLSTGGTAQALRDAGLPVTLVEEVTGFGAMLDGRVKTLHPAIHAAILADRDNPAHMQQLAKSGLVPIDVVVVNLYPFEKTIARPDCTLAEAVEMIDIGGVTLLRAAAKNHKDVLVVSDAQQFADCRAALRETGAEAARRRRAWAAKAFAQTTAYDHLIGAYLGAAPRAVGALAGAEVAEAFRQELRYGENPHQKAGLEVGSGGGRTIGEAATELSYNNYLDADAAGGLCAELWRELGGSSAVTQAPVGPPFQAVSPGVGPAFQPVLESHRLADEEHRRRHLPHIERPGGTYFVTFRLRSGELDDAERDLVLDACRHWDRRKMTVHACVVMPDHVHIVFTPFELEPKKWVRLEELTQSIKGFSARKINERRGVHGHVWQDESWDRVIRGDKEFLECLEYISQNPAKKDLGPDYRWLWINMNSWKEFEQFDQPWRHVGAGEEDRTESRLHSTDRLESRSHSQDRLESRSHSQDRLESRSPEKHAVVFVKHTNPCGVGVHEDPVEAYRRAYLADPNAAMGGILACSFSITADFAEAVMASLERWGKAAGAGAFFVEVWVAPAFEPAAIHHIRKRKAWGARVRLREEPLNRLVEVPPPVSRTVAAGTLVQEVDLLGLHESAWQVVTQRAPTKAELADLRLAWLVAKHTKSNAISLCKDGMLIGNGAGQMSRVTSCRLATWLARENGHGAMLAGAVAASDAFFPFRDGPDILAEAGITTIIQPGGSKRDAETIAACDERGLAMVFTGTRHFRH